MSRNFLSGKKILVTGGSGHLGSALCHTLVQTFGLAPSAIRVFYLAGTPAHSLADIDGLDLVPGNVLCFEDVRKACENVDFVFHMAASTSFDPRLKRLQWLVNVEGTRNVLEAVRQSTTVEKVCFTSTVNVLGVPNPVGCFGDFENSNPYTSRPRLHSFNSPKETLAFIEEARDDKHHQWEKQIGLGYFDSKLAAQELVEVYAKEFDVPVVSVLPGTCFGPYDFLIGNGQYLLTLYHGQMPGVLKGGFSAVHVLDVVEGHLQAVERGEPGARYIIAGRPEDNLHFIELAGVIVEILRQKFPGKKIGRPRLVWPSWLAYAAATVSEGYAMILDRPCRLSRDMVRAGSSPLFYSYAQAEREIGYRPKRTFRKAVEDMVEYYQAQGFF